MPARERLGDVCLSGLFGSRGWSHHTKDVVNCWGVSIRTEDFVGDPAKSLRLFPSRDLRRSSPIPFVCIGEQQSSRG